MYAVSLAVGILRGLPGIFERLESVLAGVSGVYGMGLAADHPAVGMPRCLSSHLIQLFERERFVRDSFLNLVFWLFARLCY